MFDFTDLSNLGKDYKGYILLSVDDLPDYKAKGVYLRHKRTGLEVYHVIKNDKENLFAFAFRTVSKDSLGTAHIMEHSTLCGSEKYPLKEPFNTLASTSLNTFLNALTYPDKTVYPGASVVKADYFNMMDVYADSVFFPKLDYATFIQEGHRLEMDENGKLSIQGVVYNEMKGSFSSFQQVAFNELINSMFPESYSSFDSGGDPLVIPELTYQQFLDFHQKFYNPDNCILFLYGDIPTSEQLDFLNERFISRIEKKYNCTKDVENFDSDKPLIKPEIKELMELKLNKESKEIRCIGPETGATGNMVTLNWYSGEENIEKYFLGTVLSGSDSSPVSKALKESGYGDDIAVGNFGEFREEFMSFGLSGVKKSNEKKLVDLIKKTIQDLYENGVKQEDIDAAVMGIDFNLREENRYWGPYSMQIMSKALKKWTNGYKCAQGLTPITSFEKLKKELYADKDYVKKLIKKYYIDNEVCIKVVVEPSKEYFKNREKTEAEYIKKMEKNLDREQLKKDLEALHAYQQKVETPEETNCIPTTKLSQLDSKVETFHSDLKFVKGADNSDVPFFVSKEDTNGIFYIDVLFPFDNLDAKYLKHINFLSNVITNLGWAGKSWDKCISESACVMGDVWGKIVNGTINDCPECRETVEKFKDYNFMGRKWLGITAKALTSQAEESLKMLAEIITGMDFKDEKRFMTLVQEQYSEYQYGFVSEGRDYAIKRARAGWSAHMAMVELLWGISQIETVKGYTKAKASETLKTFDYIYKECLKQGAIIHVTADAESLKVIEPLIEKLAVDANITKLLPGKSFTHEELLQYVSQKEALKDPFGSQVINVESQTGYAVASSKASGFLTKEAASEDVFCSWFSYHSLWDKIRTTGGAYGSSAWSDSGDCSAVYSSYRDPSPDKSVQVFKDALKEASEMEIPAEDVEKTVVSIYGSAIVPITPKEKGERSFNAFIYGNPEGTRQKKVDNLLSVTQKDVKEAAKRLYKNTEEVYRKVVFCDKKIEFTGNKLEIHL